MEDRTVKCCDCIFVSEIKIYSETTGTGKCEHGDTFLIGFNNNGYAVKQPRKCHAFQLEKFSHTDVWSRIGVPLDDLEQETEVSP